MTNFKTDVRFHEELRQCANAAYENKFYQFPQNYKIIEKPYHNLKNGLDAYTLQKNNSIVIVYRGTSSINDVIQDGVLMTKITPAQLKEAKIFRDSIASKYKNTEIILTGDSLGASCATYTGAITGDKAVGFNTYGVKNFVEKDGYTINSKNIVNYCNPGDLIASWNSQNIVGDCYELQSKYSNKHPLFAKDHKFTNQKPITEQIPISKYDLKKWNEVEDFNNSVKSSVENLANKQYEHLTNERDRYLSLRKTFSDNIKIPTIDEAIENFILENAHDNKFLSKMFNNIMDSYADPNFSPFKDVFVNKYERNDGTDVKAHWRSSPQK